MPETVVLRGNTSETTTVHIPDLLYIEAVGNYVKIYQLRDGQVHNDIIEAVGNYVKIYQLRDGQVHNDMLRATSKQMEEDLSSYPMIVRCHRAFLVNLQQVERIISQAGTMRRHDATAHQALQRVTSRLSQQYGPSQGNNQEGNQRVKILTQEANFWC